ncbi:MAG: beta-glucosidase, partial [Actinomycetota bacterium]
MNWPDGFIWGTGASSTQCEGAAPASDYIDREREELVPVSGTGNDFGTRYAEDFMIYKSLGLTHHRLSIEWARIEPTEGEHDRAALAHYRNMLQAALDIGVTPWICLHHFTLPRWFSDAGGFAVEENRAKYWSRHVDFMADA